MPDASATPQKLTLTSGAGGPVLIATGLFARNVQSKDLFFKDIIFFCEDFYRVKSLRIVSVVEYLHILYFQVDLIVVALRHEVNGRFLHDS